MYAIVLGRQIRVSDTTRKFKPILKSGLSIKVTWANIDVHARI